MSLVGMSLRCWLALPSEFSVRKQGSHYNVILFDATQIDAVFCRGPNNVQVFRTKVMRS